MVAREVSSYTAVSRTTVPNTAVSSTAVSNTALAASPGANAHPRSPHTAASGACFKSPSEAGCIVDTEASVGTGRRTYPGEPRKWSYLLRMLAPANTSAVAPWLSRLDAALHVDGRM